MELLALTHGNLARYHFRQDECGTALQHALVSMDYVQRLGEEVHIAVAHLHVACIQESLGDHTGALHHVRAAVVLLERLPDPIPIEAILMCSTRRDRGASPSQSRSTCDASPSQSRPTSKPASVFELPRGCCEAVARHNLALQLCHVSGDVHGAAREAAHALALSKRAYPATHQSVALFQRTYDAVHNLAQKALPHPPKAPERLRVRQAGRRHFRPPARSQCGSDMGIDVQEDSMCDVSEDAESKEEQALEAEWGSLTRMRTRSAPTRGGSRRERLESQTDQVVLPTTRRASSGVARRNDGEEMGRGRRKVKPRKMSAKDMEYYKRKRREKAEAKKLSEYHKKREDGFLSVRMNEQPLSVDDSESSSGANALQPISCLHVQTWDKPGIHNDRVYKYDMRS